MLPEQCLLKLAEMELKRAIISDPNAKLPDKETLKKTTEYLSERITFMNRFGALDKDYLVQQIQVAVLGYKCDIVVLDHITAASTANGGGWAEIDQMIYAIKGAALEHRIPILVISHINGVKHNERPTINMLRGSRALGQAVDVVLFIHRDHKAGYTEVWTGKVDRFIGKMVLMHFQMEDFNFIEIEARNAFDDDDEFNDDDEFDLELHPPEDVYTDEEAKEYLRKGRDKGKKQVRKGGTRKQPRSKVRTRAA
jgi:hypothetical protein